MTKERPLVIFMEHFPNTYFIDKKGQVFKTKVSALNADVALGMLGRWGCGNPPSRQD